MKTAELLFEHAVDKDGANKESFIRDLSSVVRKYRGEQDAVLNLSKVCASIARRVIN